MATAPVKSQPLHNFSLPFLKWGGNKNPTTSNHHHHHHRCRRPPSSADSSSPSQPLPPSADHPSEPDSDPDTRPHRVGSRTPRNRFTFSSPSPKQQQPTGRACNDETDDEAGERKRDAEVAAEAEETTQKPWNLRPRKPALSKGVALEIASRNNGELQEPVQHHHGEPKSLRLRGFAAETQCAAERKEKRKFWIALSRDEIEEDIFVMTGSRPARRPRKRPKNVQKQIDSVFPGLWLVGVTADAYRVADTPAKRLPYMVGGQSSKHIVNLQTSNSILDVLSEALHAS